MYGPSSPSKERMEQDKKSRMSAEGWSLVCWCQEKEEESRKHRRDHPPSLMKDAGGCTAEWGWEGAHQQPW